DDDNRIGSAAPKGVLKSERPVAMHRSRHDGSPSRGRVDDYRCLRVACPWICQVLQAPAFLIDHCMRSAMNLAKGSIFRSMLALSSADRYGSRSSTRTTVHR